MLPVLIVEFVHISLFGRVFSHQDLLAEYFALMGDSALTTTDACFSILWIFLRTHLTSLIEK